MKLLLIFTCIIYLISGCDSQKNNRVYKIGTNLWPGYETLHLAKINKQFRNKNIEVITYDSATIVLNKFRKKEITAAALTLDEVILLHDQGYEPIIIAVLDISDGADVLISRNSIKSINELKSNSIGVENTALGSYILARILEKAKLNYNEITIVPIAVNLHEEAFKEKVVDSVITFEPVRSKLLEAGGNEIFNSKDIPGEIVDVLVIQKNMIDTIFVDDILQGWSKSVSLLHKRDGNAIELIAQRLNQNTKDFIASLEGLKIPTIEESNTLIQSSALEKTIIKVSDIMVKKNLIKSNIQAKKLLR